WRDARGGPGLGRTDGDEPSIPIFSDGTGRGGMATEARRAMSDRISTPREDGFSMPAEWESHDACLMEWPTVTRRDFWADRFDEAKDDYAAVATAIAAF